MRQFTLAALFCSICLIAPAQTTVTTTGGTANTVPKFSGNSTVVNSAITELNGNVGIGTAPPASGLSITLAGQTIYLDPTHLMVAGNLLGGEMNFMAMMQPTFTWTNEGGHIRLGGPSRGDAQANVIQFLQNGQERMRIQSGGFVGIGGTIPLGNLDIEATAGNDYGHLIVNRSNAGAAGGQVTIRNAAGGTGASAVLGFELDGSTAFSGDANATNAEIRAVNTRVGGGGNSADLLFSNYNGSSEVTNLSIQGTTGNVGLGTSAPTARLDVRGNVAVSGTVSVGTGGGGIYGDATNTVVKTPTGGNVYFAPVGTDGTRVESNGSFRIGGPGQTTPSLRLSSPGVTFADGTTQTTAWTGITGLTGASNGNVGIGTTNPTSLLTVAAAGAASTVQIGSNAPGHTTGELSTSADTGGYFKIQSVNSQGSQFGMLALQQAGGDVVIGTALDDSRLTVESAAPLGNVSGSTVSLLSLTNLNPNRNYLRFTQRRYSNGTDWYSASTRIQNVTDTTPQGYIDFNPPNEPYGIAFGNGNTESLHLAMNGNVGLGTSAPGARLEVNGNIKLSTGSGASFTFSDGTIQSTAWTGSLCGGDYAESVDVTGPKAAYAPGDVMVVDPENEGHFLKSTEPYSTLTAGIYSTKPGLLGRRQTTPAESSTTEIPMAMVGIVPTKVSAENGPIKAGDLLVTSSTIGHAMKATDRSRLVGAVVGKALGHLDSGIGVIEVLVSLQ